MVTGHAGSHGFERRAVPCLLHGTQHAHSGIEAHLTKTRRVERSPARSEHLDELPHQGLCLGDVGDGVALLPVDLVRRIVPEHNVDAFGRQVLPHQETLRPFIRTQNQAHDVSLGGGIEVLVRCSLLRIPQKEHVEVLRDVHQLFLGITQGIPDHAPTRSQQHVWDGGPEIVAWQQDLQSIPQCVYQGLCGLSVSPQVLPHFAQLPGSIGP